MKIIVAQYAGKDNKKAPAALNIKGGVRETSKGGQNASDSAREASNSGHDIIDECPRIWMKADSALLKGGKPMFLPDWTHECTATLCLWARIKHTGKSIPQRFAHRYYEEIGVGVDFTAEDLLRTLKEAGEPWEKATSFDGAAVIGQPLANTESMQAMTLALIINGEKKVETIINNVGEVLGNAIEDISRFFTLREGDYLFLSPKDIERPKVEINDHVLCVMNDEALTEFNIK